MRPSSPDHAVAQRQFKKHKPLPRPRSHRRLDDEHDSPSASDTLSSVSLVASHPSTPRVLKHESRTIATAPALPPTPPSHSRNSSGSHPALSVADSRVLLQRLDLPLATPPDQRGPPTPDVTPPGPALRPHASHPSALDRSISKSAPMGSPMESFETAKEEPSSSDDQGGDFVIAAPKPHLIAHSRCSPLISPPELHVALERIQTRRTDAANSQARRGFARSDQTWGTHLDMGTHFDMEREPASDSRRPLAGPTRHVGFEHLHAAHKNAGNEILDHGAPFPGKSAKSGHQMSLPEAPLLSSSPKGAPHQKYGPSAPSKSDSSIHTDAKRLSGQSIKSNPSTVVEAILVDLPAQKQRTLRHVQKRGALRDTTHRLSSIEGALAQHLTRTTLSEHGAEVDRRPDARGLDVSNSMASGHARREGRDNGSIPVVVVPERRSSSNGRSTKERALRSTSGRRSKRATSPDLEIVPSPTLQQPLRRGRRRPESIPDHLEHEPAGLSPVSRAPSTPLSTHASGGPVALAEDRFGAPHSSPQSLKAEAQERTMAGSPEPQQSPLPDISIHLEPDEVHDLASLGRHDDGFSSKKFSSRNTPFSTASFETSGTAPEVSEAMAVKMFLHQNSSVLVVNHPAKPTEALRTANGEARRLAQPMIRTMSPGGGPVTPPRRDSTDEVDSPLRNPRPPPTPPAQPPAINFIPATPSGSTPAQERLARLGNYFDATVEQPSRRPSIVRRALGRRRHSVDYPPTAAKAPSLLTRTLSLSRNVRHFHSTHPTKAAVDPVCPRKDVVPADENKLHPFWRPQPYEEERSHGEGYVGQGHDADGARLSRSLGWGRWAGPSRTPKRSLSARMKRTFAVFPIHDDELFSAETTGGPERRTIRRTPSGNLRVMHRRASVDSYLRRESIRGAAYAATDANKRRSFWGQHGLRRGQGREAMPRSAVTRRWEGIQSLPRMLSERRREKRTRQLRRMISGPKDVRDGVREVIEPRGSRALRQSDGYGLI